MREIAATVRSLQAIDSIGGRNQTVMKPSSRSADPDRQRRVGGEPACLREREGGGPDAARDDRLEVRTLAGEEAAHGGIPLTAIRRSGSSGARSTPTWPMCDEPIVGTEEPVRAAVRAEERHDLLEGGLGEARRPDAMSASNVSDASAACSSLARCSAARVRSRRSTRRAFWRLTATRAAACRSSCVGTGAGGAPVPEAEAADHRAAHAEADDRDRREACGPGLGAHLWVRGARSMSRTRGSPASRRAANSGLELVSMPRRWPGPIAEAEAGGDLELALALEHDQPGARSSRGAGSRARRPPCRVPAGRRRRRCRGPRGPASSSSSPATVRRVSAAGASSARASSSGAIRDPGGEPVRAGVAHGLPRGARIVPAPRGLTGAVPSRSRSMAGSIARRLISGPTRRRIGPAVDSGSHGCQCPQRKRLPRQRGAHADRQVRRRARHIPADGARWRRDPGRGRARGPDPRTRASTTS